MSDPKQLPSKTTVDALALIDDEVPAESIAPEEIKIGQWYWYTFADRFKAQLAGQRDTKPWLGCVTHVGTNYAKLTGIGEHHTRVHFDVFDEQCTYEPDPDKVINDKVNHHQKEVNVLLGRVKEVTASLSVGPTPTIGAAETQALAVRGQNAPDMHTYSNDLVVAKTTTLPELFKEIESHHEKLALWMKAKVIPMKAEASGMHAIISSINDRIFSIELYAGLTEQVEMVREGEPAPLTTKIHLLQRRCYMDEECLAQYEVGGMEFRDIEDFDTWISRTDNFNRLLPFPRTMVAFRVRRRAKLRDRAVDLAGFLKIVELEKYDMMTFLYIRNGEQLFRMSTKIDFDAKLFPDMEHQLTGKLWTSRGGRVISDAQYQGMVEDLAQRKREYAEKMHAFQEALKTPEAIARAAAAGRKEPNFHDVEGVPYPGGDPYDRDGVATYEPYDRSNIYFDDATDRIRNQIRDHNRIALILQGLLDRSPVFHPHPPWQIWTGEGFSTALTLIYDSDRALVAGDAPDFEAFRTRCNASIAPGSVTIGQEKAWMRQEAEKEDKRRRDGYDREFYRPYGDPGPGRIARIEAITPRSKKCLFSWHLEKYSGDNKDPIRKSIEVPIDELLNLDGYKPGDFRQFFADPRTRADYIQWAPMLLAAEEYHAGKRTVHEPVPKKERKPVVRTWEQQEKYDRAKELKILESKVGDIVTLNRTLTTKGGDSFHAGTKWKIRYYSRGMFTIERVEGGERVGAVPPNYFFESRSWFISLRPKT